MQGLRQGNKKGVQKELLFRYEVGMTRLELATSRPPDVCATYCATSRFRVQRYIGKAKYPNFKVGCSHFFYKCDSNLALWFVHNCFLMV